MAKVIITIEDTDDEDLNFSFEFLPKAVRGEHTQAQRFGLELAQTLSSRADEVRIEGEEA